MGWRTVDKILGHVEPPGYRVRGQRPRPVLGAFVGVIDEILELDRDAPAKQRHTARRIFDRLRDEYGYRGSEVQVRRYVAQHRRHAREVFVPLSAIAVLGALVALLSVGGGSLRSAFHHLSIWWHTNWLFQFAVGTVVVGLVIGLLTNYTYDAIKAKRHK